MTLPKTPHHRRTGLFATGHWRAFLPGHLNFRAAADELALTQSAVSRQIQALEDEVGVPLFLRHTRAVELTSAGAQLHRAVGWPLSMDAAVRLVRQTAGRRSGHHHLGQLCIDVAHPRLEEFQRDHPASTFALMPATRSWTWTPRTWAGPALQRASPATQRRRAPVGEQLAVVASPGCSKASPSCAHRPTWPSSP